jgi:hypothetical protein
MRVYVAAVAAASLIAGFAVALLTGNRLAGGIVLLAGGAWCAVQLYRIAGAWRTVVVGLVYAASFALSHPLGAVIGSWPAVLLVAALTAAVAYLIVPKAASRS